MELCHRQSSQGKFFKYRWTGDTFRQLRVVRQQFQSSSSWRADAADPRRQNQETQFAVPFPVLKTTHVGIEIGKILAHDFVQQTTGHQRNAAFDS